MTLSIAVDSIEYGILKIWNKTPTKAVNRITTWRHLYHLNITLLYKMFPSLSREHCDIQLSSLLLLLSHFSCVRLCATPEMAAHQAPLSLGFSRQEHRRGLPFPSPVHESERWKWSRSVMSDLATPWTAAYQASQSMEFSRQEYWSGLPFPSPGHLPNPGVKPRSLALQADALPSEPPGKPINSHRTK